MSIIVMHGVRFPPAKVLALQYGVPQVIAQNWIAVREIPEFQRHTVLQEPFIDKHEVATLFLSSLDSVKRWEFNLLPYAVGWKRSRLYPERAAVAWFGGVKPEPGSLVKVAEAAKIRGVTKRTIANMAGRGAFSCFTTPGGTYLLQREALLLHRRRAAT